MIVNNKITITMMPIGLVSHNMIWYLQLLIKLIYDVLHRSNVINSCLHPIISHIMNSNLQRNIGFMTKNYKGRGLFGTGRIQSKVAKRQKNIPIILISIHIALKSLLKTSGHWLWLPICLWIMRLRLWIFTPKIKNQSIPESWSKPEIMV